MGRSKGRYLAFSSARRIVADIMYFSRHRPLVPIEREMNLEPLMQARQQIPAPRPGWCSIFVKAYSILSMRVPELRRSYLPYPWARLYETVEPVAAIAIERELEGELAVMPGLLRHPQTRSLMEIEQFLLTCKEAPFREIGSMRRTLRYLKWPRFLRRALGCLTLNWWGSKRAEIFGTFGISVTAGMGAATLALLSPLTTTLHYGRFDDWGRLPVRLTFDHHVLDAGLLSRALVQLEEILLGEILDELQTLANCPEREAVSEGRRAGNSREIVSERFAPRSR
jgi:hypothetical protein